MVVTDDGPLTSLSSLKDDTFDVDNDTLANGMGYDAGHKPR